jgi:hypothetical protein
MPEERATSESFAHYCGLKNSLRYLPMDRLEEGCAYLIHARNGYIGIWSGEKRGFTLLRKKFESLFLSIEYHYDTGAPFGTAKPFVKVSGPCDPKQTRAVLDELLLAIPREAFFERTRAFLAEHVLPEAG